MNLFAEQKEKYADNTFAFSRIVSQSTLPINYHIIKRGQYKKTVVKIMGEYS